MEVFTCLDDVKDYLNQMGYTFVIEKSYINYNTPTAKHPVTISLSGRLQPEREKSNVK